jgi:phosphoribosylformylglycinamidine (FGAM) synthase-like enzyme
MAIAARSGLSVVVPADGADPTTALFNEAPGRIVVAASPSSRDDLAARLGDHARRVGEATGDHRIALRVADADQAAEGIEALSMTLVEVNVAEAIRAFIGSADS